MDPAREPLHANINALDLRGYMPIAARSPCCARIDGGAADSARFIHDRLLEPSTTEQAWPFLGVAIATYCPTHQSALLRV